MLEIEVAERCSVLLHSCILRVLDLVGVQGLLCTFGVR